MNKLALSLIALAALSTTSFANDRTEEGTAASRNVANGAVWAAQAIVNSDTASFEVRAGESTDFAMMKQYGIEHESR